MNAKRSEQLTIAEMPKEFTRLLELLRERDELKKQAKESSGTFKQCLSELDETIYRLRTEIETGQKSFEEK